MSMSERTERNPWNSSYRMSFEARPSWARHGMPDQFPVFQELVRNDNNNHGVHLDIGCGNGAKTVVFAKEGYNTIGVDLSEDGFQEARELIHEFGVSERCRLVKANCLNLPFKTTSAYSATDILCFTHLNRKDYPKYKRELSRVLQAGAYILMVLFSDKDEHFHGHKVSKTYTFRYNPDNPLMDGYVHYHGMYNVHFDEQDIIGTFKDTFDVVNLSEVDHPLYPHRKLWNVIMRKPPE